MIRALLRFLYRMAVPLQYDDHPSDHPSALRRPARDQRG